MVNNHRFRYGSPYRPLNFQGRYHPVEIFSQHFNVNGISTSYFGNTVDVQIGFFQSYFQNFRQSRLTRGTKTKDIGPIEPDLHPSQLETGAS